MLKLSAPACHQKGLLYAAGVACQEQPTCGKARSCLLCVRSKANGMVAGAVAMPQSPPAQMAVIRLHEKRTHRITDKYFDRQCALDHRSRPKGNNCARSLYLTNKVVGVKDAGTIQVRL